MGADLRLGLWHFDLLCNRCQQVYSTVHNLFGGSLQALVVGQDEQCFGHLFVDLRRWDIKLLFDGALQPAFETHSGGHLLLNCWIATNPTRSLRHFFVPLQHWDIEGRLLDVVGLHPPRHRERKKERKEK